MLLLMTSQTWTRMKLDEDLRWENSKQVKVKKMKATGMKKRKRKRKKECDDLLMSLHFLLES
jgi:hypothetical protein